MSRPNLKRKAEEQLTRMNAEAKQEAGIMSSLKATLSSLANYCYDFFTGPASFAMPADQVLVSSAEQPESTTPQYTSATLPTIDKRRKLSKNKRAQSASSTSRMPGLPPVDFSGCKDETDRRECVNEYWTPKPGIDISGCRPRRKSQISHSNSATEARDQTRRQSSSASYRENLSRLSRSPSDPGHVSPVPTNPPDRLPLTPDSSHHETVPKDKNERGSLNLFTVRTAIEDISSEGSEGDALRPSSCKLAKLEKQRILDEEKAIDEALEAARKRRTEGRKKRRDPLKPLIEALNSKWDAIVNDAQVAPHDTPIAKSLEGTQLHNKDFRTLLGQCSWLNDEIINTYIEWVVDAAKKAAVSEAEAWGEQPSTVPKFIAHNSFFYENLKKNNPPNTDRLMKRKKAEGAKLLEVDTIFIPICQSLHWTMGVVRPQARTIEYFDSMGGSSSKFNQLIRGWLERHLGAKYNEQEWTTPRTSCALQTNGYDCGVFVCTNVFCVAAGISTSSYLQQHMTLQRRAIAAILINEGFKGDFEWGRDGLLPVAEHLNCGPDGLRGEIARRIRARI